VDPYNELDHQRPSHMSETEYVSQMLTKIKRFAQHHDVHVWFVAHPRQLRVNHPPCMTSPAAPTSSTKQTMGWSFTATEIHKQAQ